MKLFLLRHAPAEYGGPDPDRPLSESGRRVAMQLARFVENKRHFTFAEIWCSPYLRARQTAEPFIHLGGKPRPIEYRDDLTPYGEPADLLPHLLKRSQPLLVVGHNPHLGNLVRLLLGLDSPQVHVPVKKGGLYIFKRDNAGATGFTLSAVLTPAALGLKG